MAITRSVFRQPTVQAALLTVLLVTVGATALATARLATAGYSPAGTWEGYSFESGCSTAVDTITIVLTNGSGNYDDPFQHGQYSDHGGFDNHEVQGDQSFEDDVDCTPNTDGGATEGGWSNDRWHFRAEVAYTTSMGQTYALTPHWDDWNWDIWGISGHHCVHYDGFTAGRSYTYSAWTSASDGHSGNQNNYWGNTMAIPKCGGEYAYTNGYVWYIDLP